MYNLIKQTILSKKKNRVGELKDWERFIVYLCDKELKLEYCLPLNQQNGWWKSDHENDIKKFERWIEIHNEKEIQKTTQKAAEEMNRLFNS